MALIRGSRSARNGCLTAAKVHALYLRPSWCAANGA
jgi:hypothetical protein